MTPTTSDGVDTKRAALAALSRGGAPRYLLVTLVVFATARLALGDLRWSDAALVAFMVIIQPFVEWLVHVHLLHARPKTVLGLRVDLGAEHRIHHEAPRDLTVLFFPVPSLIGGQVAFALIYAVAFRSVALVLTGMTIVTALSLYYEWIHLLAHTAYRPRLAYFRNIWRAHRLHHYKSEHYWYGITNTVADRVLKTFPDKNTVPTSPTAKDLFGENL